MIILNPGYNQEEKIERTRHENPSRERSTFIKYIFIAFITLIVLAFVVYFLFPMFSAIEEDRNGNDQIEIDNRQEMEVEETEQTETEMNDGEETGSD